FFFFFFFFFFFCFRPVDKGKKRQDTQFHDDTQGQLELVDDEEDDIDDWNKREMQLSLSQSR
ncbi:MAG TPA: hypothetical protein VIH61_05830, partial [Waddliaceae bacterium]